MTALLDRERELAELDAIVAEAAGGHGRLVLMEGAAGIGKSGLLTGLRERIGLLGGDFVAGPRRQGFALCARLPLS